MLEHLELIQYPEHLIAQHAERRLVRLVPMELEHVDVVGHHLVQLLREHRRRVEASPRKLGDEPLHVLGCRVRVELVRSPRGRGGVPG